MPENSSELGDRTRSIRIVAVDRSYFQRPPCVERWLRNRAPTTQKHYLGFMGRFQLLTGLSPEQFLQWCKTVESVEVQDLIDKTSFEFKPAIQFCYRVALRSFLHHNGYNSLPKTDLRYVSQKMVIEGHFAGTRTKHYTDRDREELRDVYRRAYPFIRLSVAEPVLSKTDNETYSRRLRDLEARLDRQRGPRS